MTVFGIESQEVLEKLGLKTLKDEGIEEIAYVEILDRLQDELMKKRNKTFGWTDAVNIELDGESWVDTYWAVAINGKIVQVKLEYDGIALDGNSRDCQKLGKQFLKLIGKLSRKSILRKIKPELTADQLTTLKNWEIREAKRNSPRKQKKRNL